MQHDGAHAVVRGEVGEGVAQLVDEVFIEGVVMVGAVEGEICHAALVDLVEKGRHLLGLLHAVTYGTRQTALPVWAH